MNRSGPMCTENRNELFLKSNGSTPDLHSDTADSGLLDCEDTDTIQSFNENPKHSRELLDMKMQAILKTTEECKLTQTSVDAIFSSALGTSYG